MSDRDLDKVETAIGTALLLALAAIAAFGIYRVFFA